MREKSLRDLPWTNTTAISVTKDQIAKEALEINSMPRACINITHTGATIRVQKMASLPRTDSPVISNPLHPLSLPSFPNFPPFPLISGNNARLWMLFQTAVSNYTGGISDSLSLLSKFVRAMYRVRRNSQIRHETFIRAIGKQNSQRAK